MRRKLTRDAHENVILPVRLHHVPKAPPTLDKIGRKAWRFMAGERLAAGCLTAADLPILERYALAYQTSENAGADIQERAWEELIVLGLALRPPRRTAPRRGA